MIEEMLTRQTQRWQTAVAARAHIDEARGAEPRSAVPALDGWLAPFRERDRESSSICAPIGTTWRRKHESFAWWAQLGSNQ
jgi:hypothetical protein